MSTEWSGELLDSPEMMAAFSAQLRRALSEHAEWLARIRRDAEAMWRANPPEGYGSFEAWWRHRQVTGPFAEIQAHLEKAATLTFALEARHRRNRHEIPAARQAAEQARQAPALTRGEGAAAGQARSAVPQESVAPRGDFLSLIRDGEGQKRRPA
ncbi:hypothetical protein [Microbispora rosea]|uniref:hypothetical protein n=1 Tax=Microbispora rosea TaxID=58117 RepID=UPI0037B8984A